MASSTSWGMAPVLTGPMYRSTSRSRPSTDGQPRRLSRAFSSSENTSMASGASIPRWARSASSPAMLPWPSPGIRRWWMHSWAISSGVGVPTGSGPVSPTWMALIMAGSTVGSNRPRSGPRHRCQVSSNRPALGRSACSTISAATRWSASGDQANGSISARMLWSAAWSAISPSVAAAWAMCSPGCHSPCSNTVIDRAPSAAAAATVSSAPSGDCIDITAPSYSATRKLRPSSRCRRASSSQPRSCSLRCSHR